MFGKGSASDLPQGCGGQGRCASFLGDWLMRVVTADPGAPPQQIQEAAAAPDPSESSSELELSSSNDIMQKVKDYVEIGVAMINFRPQGTGGDVSPAANPAHTRSSIGAGPLTSTTQATTSGTHYVCRDWVSQVNIKRLKYIACQFWLSEELYQP